MTLDIPREIASNFEEIPRCIPDPFKLCPNIMSTVKKCRVMFYVSILSRTLECNTNHSLNVANRALRQSFVKQLLIIKGKDGNEILSFPVTVGVAGIVLAPVFATVGTITALATECTIVIER